MADPRAGAQIAERLPLRRRRLGLALMALGVLLLAAQSIFEWMLPYDFAVLARVREWLGRPQLGAATLAWAWALACWLALLPLARERGGLQVLAPVAGLMLGSAQLAAGGAPAAVAMLVLVGVASLGWQTRAQGGLALLLGAALGVAGWDAWLSGFPTLWTFAGVLVATFVWIDHQHIRANDRRLLAALEERDALIRDLDARGEQLQLVQDARTRLLASVSHDLRQPLQAVRLYADALQARTETDEQARALLRRQLQAADDAVAMLDQFSEFSAIEHGMLVSHPELVNLREVLERVAGTLEAIHPRQRLRMEVYGRRDRCWVWADRSQLARVVQNLAGNAVRYSIGAHGAKAARVVLAARPAGPDLAIDVIDNGRGIPPDKVGLLFQAYVQLPLDAGGGETARPGRGLGLAIVRGLVQQLGLVLAPIRSTLGHGTRFRIIVPAELRRPPPAPAAADGKGSFDRLDGWLIALLDDEEAPRLALRVALEGLGATVIDAPSLARLKPLLDAEERFPDALVFDLDLGPGRIDGRGAMVELREEWELIVPAVILTGRVGSRSVILPPRCSLHEKPVSLPDLVVTLHRISPRPALA